MLFFARIITTTRNSLLLDLTRREESVILLGLINNKYSKFVQYVSLVKIPRRNFIFSPTGG